MGPAFLVRATVFGMHPLDTGARTGYLKNEGGIGHGNITRCCTEVCPRESASPTTPSSRSRSGWWTATMTRCANWCSS